jgi:hypothetical protein
LTAVEKMEKTGQYAKPAFIPNTSNPSGTPTRCHTGVKPVCFALKIIKKMKNKGLKRIKTSKK